MLNTVHPQSKKWVVYLQMVNEDRINGESGGNSLQLLTTAPDCGLNDISIVSKET